MKTKIGLSAGAYAAITFLLALFGGYTPLIIAVGYVLIFESNDWLKSTVLKALCLMVCLSLLSTLLTLIPDLFSFFDDCANVFNGNVPYGKLSQVIIVFRDIISLFRTVFFIILAIMALKMKTIKFGPVDKFVEKHLSMGE